MSGIRCFLPHAGICVFILGVTAVLDALRQPCGQKDGDGEGPAEEKQAFLPS